MEVADWLTESELFSILGFNNSCSAGLLPSSASAFTAASTSACVSFPRGIKPVWPLEDEDAAVVVGACVLGSSGSLEDAGVLVGACVLGSSGSLEDADDVVGACVLGSSGSLEDAGVVVGACVLASSGLSVGGVGGVGMSTRLDREELSGDSASLSEDSRSESSSPSTSS